MHLTWSDEKENDVCECGEKTILVSFGSPSIDTEDPRCDELGEWLEIPEELTGHFCLKCNKLTSLSLNT